MKGSTEMHGNSDVKILQNAVDAKRHLALAIKQGNTAAAQMWQREYDNYMRRYLRLPKNV